MALNVRDEAIRRLADGFSREFAEFCAGDERVHDLMMELAAEFVNDNIPIVDEEASFDVATELLLAVTVTKV